MRIQEVRMLAYIDAGSGSIIASAVVAGVAGGGVAIKSGLRRLTGRGKKNATTTEPEIEATDDATLPAEAAEERAL
jgi:hypothetical protein